MARDYKEQKNAEKAQFNNTKRILLQTGLEKRRECIYRLTPNIYRNVREPYYI